MWAVIFIRGQLSRGGGGGGLLWLVLLFGCHVAVSNMGPQCHWRGGGVGCSSLLVPFMGGVLSRSCRRLIVWCHPAVVVAWLSSVVVVVVVSHHCRRLWLLTWHSCVIRMVCQHVQVVVSGGRWCGNDGWVLWVGVMGGCHEWVSWVGVVGGGGGG